MANDLKLNLDGLQLELGRDMHTLRLEAWAAAARAHCAERENWVYPQRGETVERPPHSDVCVMRFSSSGSKESRIKVVYGVDAVHTGEVWMAYEHLSVQMSLPVALTQGEVNGMTERVLQLMDPIVRTVWPVAGHDGELYISHTIKASPPIPVLVGRQAVARTPITAHFFRDTGTPSWDEPSPVPEPAQEAVVTGRPLDFGKDPVLPWVEHPGSRLLYWKPIRNGPPGLAAVCYLQSTGGWAVAVFRTQKNQRRFLTGNCRDAQHAARVAEGHVSKIIESGDAAKRQ
jgi:hypothetical protein